ENIPSTYHVIGLFVTEHRDSKILKQEYKKQFKDDNNEVTVDADKMEQSTLPKPEEVIIVGDYRKIKEKKNIVIKYEKEYKKENKIKKKKNREIKTKKEYKKKKIIEEMKRIEQETSLITDESIPFEKELIDTLMKEKATLKEDMKYETEEEKDQSEKEIEQKE